MLRSLRAVTTLSSVQVRSRSSSVIRVNVSALKEGKKAPPQKKGTTWVNSSLTELTNKVMACSPPDMQRIDHLITGNASEMTASNITAVLYQCSRKRIPLTANQLELLITFLQQRDEKLWNKQASNLLYSCRNLKDHEKQALELLNTIAVKMSKSTEGPFTTQAIGNSLYGLQHFSNSSPEMKSLFRILTLKIITCKESMKPQEMCNALFGLKYMNAKSSEMQRLLAYFAEKIPRVENSFTGQGLATAVCGLESMDTNCEEVRAVMAALTEKIHANPQARFTEEGISMALYSFRNKNSHFDEAKHLIEVLSLRLLEMDSTLFSGETVGNLLNGLSKMNGSHRVYRDLISRVTEKIEVSEDFLPAKGSGDRWQMSPHDIFKAFCGFYNLNSDHVEVRQLLTALVDRLNRQDELQDEEAAAAAEGGGGGGGGRGRGQVLESKVIANSLYSLRNMQNNRNEVNYLLKWIETHLNLSLQALEQVRPEHAEAMRKHVSFNPSETAKSLYGLRSMTMMSRGKDVACAIKDTNLCRVLSALQRLLVATGSSSPVSGHSTSHTMSLEQISIAVFGMRGLHGSHPEVDALLQLLVSQHRRGLLPEHLLELDPATVSTRVARVLYGLQGKLCDGNEGGSAVMELVADVLEHPELKFEFSPKSFCISICGLGTMDSVTNTLFGGVGGDRDGHADDVFDETRRILLSGIVKRAPSMSALDRNTWKGEQLEDSRMDRHFPSYGLVLQGLSGMSSEHDEVREAIGLLANTMDSLPSRSTDSLSDVILGFGSLANMSSSFEEVRQMLEFLNERLLRHDLGRISYDDVSDMMIGMQRMHSTHNKVSKVLTNVVNILAQQRLDKKKVFVMRNLASILFGLQSSSSNDGIVKKLLSEIYRIISEGEEDALGVMTGRQLVLCLVGLQNMNLDHPEVEKLWRVLLAALENTPTRVTRSSVEKCLSLLRERTEADTGGRGLVEDMERLLHEKNNQHSAAAAAAAPREE
jgi:hypothetical protein